MLAGCQKPGTRLCHEVPRQVRYRRGEPAAPHRGRTQLARKPNYKFERMERDRAKAAKKAARAEAKKEKLAQRQGEDGEALAEAPGEVPEGDEQPPQ